MQRKKPRRETLPDDAAASLEQRSPVWQALSELFLDTELDRRDLQRIAETLNASPYTVAELESILYDEVYPVCIANLLCVAGVWSGFDPDWLRERILNQRRRRFFRRGRLRLHRWMIEQQWREIKTRLNRS